MFLSVPVHLMDDGGRNHFSAGHSTHDAEEWPILFACDGNQPPGDCTVSTNVENIFPAWEDL